jgi:CubicO group peptidase (beta-lactamase class C family)
MKLDDPVQKYLPASVKMPTRNGKQITLLHLATHTSGLPHIAENLNPQRPDQPFADYTVEELNTFLSNYQLTSDPGAKFQYSSLGAGLLGHVIALKAGSDYESLVVDRICRPLKMDSTRITLTPELKSRFATGHNRFGEAVPSWERQTQLGGSALRSTANDMLKFVSANLGFTRSSLTPLMEKTHKLRLDQTLGEDLGLAWGITRLPQEREIIWHAGGAPGYVTFAGFDKARRRGVVILSSSWDLDVVTMGFLLLGSEWQPDKRPKETKISSQIYDSSVGQYELSPSFSLGGFVWRMLLLHIPKAVIYIPVGLSLALLLVLVRRATTVRTRRIIVGSSALVTGLLMFLVILASSHVVCALCHPTLGIRREGDRLFVQYDLRLAPITGKLITPAQAKALPQITGELLAESETRFFGRTTGMPVTFSRDDRGKATRLTTQFLGASFTYKKISDQPPEAYTPPKTRAAIKLDAKLLDACVGIYQFATTAERADDIHVTIKREGDQLLWQARDTIPGPFNIYPESETTFFLKVSGGHLTFRQDDTGKVTAFSLRDDAWLPDGVGRKQAE